MDLADAADLCFHWSRHPPINEAYAAVHGLVREAKKPCAVTPDMIDDVIRKCGG